MEVDTDAAARGASGGIVHDGEFVQVEESKSGKENKKQGELKVTAINGWIGEKTKKSKGKPQPELLGNALDGSARIVRPRSRNSLALCDDVVEEPKLGSKLLG